MEDRRDTPSFQSVGHEQVQISVPAELAPEVRRMVDSRQSSAAFGTGQLEYQTPAPPRRRPLADWPLLFTLVFFCGVLHILAAVIVPVYVVHYRDLGMKLSTSTVIILRLARFITNDYGWAYIWPLAIAIPVVAAALRRTPPRCGRGLGLAFVLVLILTSLLLLFGLTALTAPILTMRSLHV
jgi:hypothetical protein